MLVRVPCRVCGTPHLDRVGQAHRCAPCRRQRARHARRARLVKPHLRAVARCLRVMAVLLESPTRKVLGAKALGGELIRLETSLAELANTVMVELLAE